MCSEVGCSKPAKKRGLCENHYEQRRRRQPCKVCGMPKPRGPGTSFCSDDCRAVAAAAARTKARGKRKEWYARNRERVLARQKARQDSDPEYRAYKSRKAREWALAHPELTRERRRRSWAAAKYGLTLEEVDAILALGCAICGTTNTHTTRGDGEGRLCIDHCHATGAVRAALCHKCNAGLGMLGDDSARLRAAADYLDSHNIEL